MKCLLGASDMSSGLLPSLRAMAREIERNMDAFAKDCANNGNAEITAPRVESMKACLSGMQGLAETSIDAFGLLLAQTFGTRQFAVTETGAMVLVPWGTRKGDGVVLFLGERRPLILRDESSSGAREGEGDAEQGFSETGGRGVCTWIYGWGGNG